MNTWLLISLALVAVTSFFLTAVVRAYAVRIHMIDQPVERSSHSIPTPRGGGLGFVVTFLLGGVLHALWFSSHGYQPLGLLLAAFLVAGIGFMDDHRHIPARWRLLVHILAASLLMWAIPIPETVALFGVLLDDVLYIPIVVVALVWLINLFNFMDGIDGIASIEAVSVLLVAGYLLLDAQATGQAILLFGLAAAVAGFLYWNLPPAKIFMGDVASGFLGLTLGGAALLCWQQGSHYLVAILIMLAVFIVDATCTLLVRLVTGQHVFDAHRLHGYQKLTVMWGSHGRVSYGVLAINLLWLCPLALLATHLPEQSFWLLVIAYSPLLAGVIYLRAGLLEEEK